MSKNGLSRRDFLKLAGATSAGLTLSACGMKATELPVPTSTYTAIPSLTSTLTTTNTPTPTPTRTPTSVPAPTTTPLPPTLRNLADEFGFKIGAFFGGSNTTSQDFDNITEVLVREFNLGGIFSGMSMTQPNKGEFQLDSMKWIFNKAKTEKMDIFVHPLI